MSQPDSHLLRTASHLGQLLAAARKQRKLTQTAVARIVGISQNRLSHLEHHPEEISIKQLFSWCAALELELQMGVRDTSAPSRQWD
jgi:HTH-type transcriptional regulator/antitoxin HipB